MDSWSSFLLHLLSEKFFLALCVCVCVCVCSWGLNPKPVHAMLVFYCSAIPHLFPGFAWSGTLSFLLLYSSPLTNMLHFTH
jgi:hypothetical protein